MIYLAPIGGFVDNSFGILTTPGMRGIPSGIKAGMRWAADNQAFTKGFDHDIFFPWLETMNEYRSTCLFVTCPDVIGKAPETIALFEKWRNRFDGWPVAFVAQDGQELLAFPDAELWDCLFLGGSTIWKMSEGAIKCIRRAQKKEKHIHIGRVNFLRRYNHFAALNGSERFTCDGTRTRFERTKAIRAWKNYMEFPRQYGLFVPPGDNLG